MNAPRILVCGGGGFIGHAVAAQCVKKGWRVTTIGRKSSSSALPEGVRVWTLDVRDTEAVKALLEGEAFEYVVNCAGYINHVMEGEEAKGVFDTHFHGMVNVVEALDRKALRGLVQIGSSDEYGNRPAPQSEDMREGPISPYSLAKTAATHYIQMRHNVDGLPGVVLRLFLVYGPGQDARRFIPQVMRGCLAGERVETTAGEQLRDFCYIDDAVEGILRALENPETRGEVINLGSGTARSVRSVIDEIATLAGSGLPVYGARDYRPGENMALYPDVSKARSLLGWEPVTEFREGLERTLAYYRTLGAS